MGDSVVAGLEECGADGSADGSGFRVASSEVQWDDGREGIKDGSRGDGGDMRVEGSQSSAESNLFEQGIGVKRGE